MLLRTLAAILTPACAIACASAPPPAPCAPPAQLQPADNLESLSSEQLATKLMEQTGAAKLGKQVMDQMAESLKKMPSLPPGFIQRFTENARPDELTALLIPIYVKELDRDTLIATIRFNDSKPGRALIAKLPMLTQEGMAAGREWGTRLAQKTLAEMGAAARTVP